MLHYLLVKSLNNLFIIGYKFAQDDTDDDVIGYTFAREDID